MSEAGKDGIQNNNTFSTKRLADGILHEMSYLVNSLVHQWEKPISFLSYLLEDVINASENIPAGAKVNTREIATAAAAGKELTGFLERSVKNLESLFEESSTPVDFDLISALDEVIAVSEVFLKGTDLQYSVMCGCDTAQCEIGPDKELDCSEAKLNVRGFPAPLKRALIYLILNAKEAINNHKPSGGGLIRADLQEKDGNILIVVENNGGNIPEADIDKIFKPYYTTRNDRKAAGMGLFLAKITVEQRFNGVIYVENTEDGVRFVLTFPKDGGHPAVDPDEPQILYVSMDGETKSKGCNILNEHFKNVICASNGIEGITQFMQHNPDIVIISKLPKMNSFLLGETIKKISLQKPVMVIVEEDQEVDENEYDLIDKIIRKPFDKLDLLDAIYDLIQ